MPARTRKVYGYVKDYQNNPMQGVTVVVEEQFFSWDRNFQASFNPSKFTTTTDVNGYWEMTLVVNEDLTPTSYYAVRYYDPVAKSQLVANFMIVLPYGDGQPVNVNTLVQGYAINQPDLVYALNQIRVNNMVGDVYIRGDTPIIVTDDTANNTVRVGATYPNTAPPAVGQGAVGTSIYFARADHTHDGVTSVNNMKAAVQVVGQSGIQVTNDSDNNRVVIAPGAVLKQLTNLPPHAWMYRIDRLPPGGNVQYGLAPQFSTPSKIWSSLFVYYFHNYGTNLAVYPPSTLAHFLTSVFLLGGVTYRFRLLVLFEAYSGTNGLIIVESPTIDGTIWNTASQQTTFLSTQTLNTPGFYQWTGTLITPAADGWYSIDLGLSSGVTRAVPDQIAQLYIHLLGFVVDIA